MALRSSFATLFLCFAACAPDISFVPKDPLVEVEYATILVEPRVIDFGEKTSKDTVRQTVTVTNTGLNVLDVTELTLEIPQSFTVVPNGDRPHALPPAESWTFDVVFHPMDAGSVAGVITVHSDAVNEPVAPVTLAGRGAIPILEITPDPMKFGERFIPCDAQQSFTLKNVGSEPLVISDVVLEGDASMLSLPVPVPENLTLDLNRSYTLPVKFSPTAPASFRAELVVSSNDPDGETHVPISGAGRYGQEVTEQFIVPEVIPINVIVAVDQSCSMSSHQDQLNSQFASFIGVFVTAQVKWKLGVVTADSGCMTIINAQTANWQTAFNTAIRGAGGSLTESLLKLTQNATTASCNASFRDAGAPLHILMVSDERDQSAGYPTTNYWNQYLTSYRNYAGAGAPVKVHAAVDTLFQTGGTTQGPGGYQEAVGLTGGTLLDVYNANWPSALAGIAAGAVADIGIFELGQRNADPNSLRVWVDGVEVTSGWRYDVARRSLIFEESEAPVAHSTIDVTYGVGVNCGP